MPRLESWGLVVGQEEEEELGASLESHEQATFEGAQWYRLFSHGGHQGSSQEKN